MSAKHTRHAGSRCRWNSVHSRLHWLSTSPAIRPSHAKDPTSLSGLTSCVKIQRQRLPDTSSPHSHATHSSICSLSKPSFCSCRTVSYFRWHTTRKEEKFTSHIRISSRSDLKCDQSREPCNQQPCSTRSSAQTDIKRYTLPPLTFYLFFWRDNLPSWTSKDFQLCSQGILTSQCEQKYEQKSSGREDSTMPRNRLNKNH